MTCRILGDTIEIFLRNLLKNFCRFFLRNSWKNSFGILWRSCWENMWGSLLRNFWRRLQMNSRRRETIQFICADLMRDMLMVNDRTTHPMTQWGMIRLNVRVVVVVLLFASHFHLALDISSPTHRQCVGDHTRMLWGIPGVLAKWCEQLRPTHMVLTLIYRVMSLWDTPSLDDSSPEMFSRLPSRLRRQSR